MSILNAITAWLPYPVYRLVGGPADGSEQAVELRETPQGMVPPEYVRIKELPPVSLKPFDLEALPVDLFYTVHTYRFVPDARQINIGHYEHVASA